MTEKTKAETIKPKISRPPTLLNHEKKEGIDVKIELITIMGHDLPKILNTISNVNRRTRTAAI